jgi:hypothetical protein
VTDNLAADASAAVHGDVFNEHRLVLDSTAAILENEFGDMFDDEIIDRFLGSSYEKLATGIGR